MPERAESADNYQVETSFDANRNAIQVDTQDVVVQYASNDPNDPRFATFVPTGNGTTANLPTMPGPGGAVRPGWFSNLYTYDLLDNKIQQDIDCTGSSVSSGEDAPASLVTAFTYDFNQNQVKITKPLGNTIEYDYDERDLKIAIRVGGPSGSVTVMAYDGNKDLIDAIGPATRGTAAQTLSCIIGDAFGGSFPATFSGDWMLQNVYDGFDRRINAIDAAGGMMLQTFDPGSRAIAAQTYGSPGEPTPTDRGGSANVLLASREARFDEAGRRYEAQKDVFLDGGTYYHGVGGSLPSGRAVTHTGGGLAANSTTNNHTATVTLTAGGTSYVLERTVFDRADRPIATAADNGAVTTIALDGAGRQPLITDALGNSLQQTFDGNGNTTFMTSVELCTISGSIAAETFSSAAAFDVLDRPVVRMDQGADGSLAADWPTCCADAATATLITYFGFDSRNNRTNLVDPKQNTVTWEFDGAGRQLREKCHLRPSGDGTTAISATVLTQTAYDANSNTIRLVDNNGGITGWAYDLLDRSTVMTFHDSSTRTNVFNAASDIVGYTDENGSIFTNTPDVLGRITGVAIAPAAGVAGNAALTAVPGTLALSFQFDGLSRPTFCRDSVGTVGGMGGLVNADVGFTRDSIDRVLEEQQAYLGDTRFITHNAFASYPGTSFTFPNGRQINKSFDALYRKNAINETSGGASIAAWQFFGGRTATVTLGNGIVTSFMNNAQNRSAIQLGQTTPAWGSISTDQLGYDGAARPIGKRHILSGTTIVGFTTAYDLSSNKLFERALHAEGRSSLYTTDSMDRLLQYLRGTLATGGGSVTTPVALPNTNSQQSYTLDGLGNWPNTSITPVGLPQGLQLRTHNKLNQLLAFGVAPASTPVLYDHGNNTGANASRGNGNITNDGTRANVFDALNRLRAVNRVSDGHAVAVYVYDAIARRIIRTVLGAVSFSVPLGTNRYFLDGQQIVEELSAATGPPAIQYVWGQYIDELIQLKVLTTIGPQPLSAGSYYLLSDLLYRSAALTNSTGGIVEAFDTGAYGDTLLFSAGGGTGGAWFSNADTQAGYSACRYVFTGREWDAEAGMYFYRARYYDPPLGRMSQRDPRVLLAPANLYEYGFGMPLTFIDPFGTQASVWTFSGINNWNGNRFNDYVGQDFAGGAEDVSFASHLGTTDDYNPRVGIFPFTAPNARYNQGANVLRLGSRGVLDAEAEIAARGYFGGDLCRTDGHQSRVRVLMIAPKTTTRPPEGAECCCDIQVEVYWDPYDNVPNQDPLQPNNPDFWSQFGHVNVVVGQPANPSASFAHHLVGSFLHPNPVVAQRLTSGPHKPNPYWAPTGATADNPLDLFHRWRADQAVFWGSSEMIPHGPRVPGPVLFEAADSGEFVPRGWPTVHEYLASPRTWPKIAGVVPEGGVIRVTRCSVWTTTEFAQRSMYGDVVAPGLRLSDALLTGVSRPGDGGTWSPDWRVLERAVHADTRK